MLHVALSGGPVAAVSFSVDRSRPASSLSSLATVNNAPITVTIAGNDDLSGVDLYRVQYRTGASGAWTDWLTQTAGWSYTAGDVANLVLTFGLTHPVTLKDNTTYCFRVQAVDRAGNAETAHANADSCTLYQEQRRLYLPIILKSYPPPPPPSANRYVKRYGTDSGDCHTPAAACGSIQYALDMATPGDAIAIAGYTDALTNRRWTYWGAESRPAPSGYYGPASIIQVAYVSKTVTLRGGYKSDFTAWDPTAYKTVLPGRAKRRPVRTGHLRGARRQPDDRIPARRQRHGQ